LPGIGFLSGASLEAMRDYLTVFKQSLAETGFTEGRDVAIELGASTSGALVAQVADNQSRLQSFWALQSVSCSAVTNDSRLVSASHARSDHAGTGGFSTLFKLYRK
jgi:hypothetical protein